MPPVPPPRILPDLLPAQYNLPFDITENDVLKGDHNMPFSTPLSSPTLQPVVLRQGSTSSLPELRVDSVANHTIHNNGSYTQEVNASDPEADAVARAISRNTQDYDFPLLDSVGLGQQFQARLGQVAQFHRPMYLFKAVETIVACQESMYQELLDCIAREHDLGPYGWHSDDEFVGLSDRAKFEKLMERYTS